MNKRKKLNFSLKKNKRGNFKPIIFIMLVSLIIAGFWDKFSVLKNSVHLILDPSAGALIEWNLTLGMLILVLIISIITTLIQKYATDQKTLKELRKEQKIVQEEIKKFKDNPQKLMELQKKQFEFLPKTMKLNMRALMFTSIPFILLFRWFWDFFTNLGNPKFFGIFSWFWFYLIFTIIFSSILKKTFDVV